MGGCGGLLGSCEGFWMKGRKGGGLCIGKIGDEGADEGGGGRIRLRWGRKCWE